MAKTQEELNALKEELKTLNKKLAELSDEELAQVVGGGMVANGSCPYGKTYADQECNFINNGNMCQYSHEWEYSRSEYREFICEKGGGRFNDDIRDNSK